MFDIKSVPKITIREGSIGNATIRHYEGFYTLFVNDEQQMAINTKANGEIKEFYSSYDLAEGDVLLSGLGFGICAQWIASKPEVTSVTVVEFSQNVLDLFLRHNILDSKIKVVIADIKEYKDSARYNWVILDHYENERVPTREELAQICSNIETDNLWFWSLETHLVYSYNSWSKFRESYNLTIPDLPVKQVLEYVKNLFIKKDFHLDQ
jgi:spermidine synthase